jgi:hypothetical protein
VNGEYERLGTTLPLARRGEAILEYVAAGLALGTGGASELLAPALRRVVQRRIEGLRDALLKDLKAGAITQDAVIQEDDLASFVIRMQRAALEGCATRKLRLMSAYFFRRAPSEHFSEDMFLTFAGITEQLSESEIRALAVIKSEIISGKVSRTPVKDQDKIPSRRVDIEPELLDLFRDKREFVPAAASLVRFGFLEAASGYGTLVYFATDPLFHYLEEIDLHMLKPQA